MLYTDNIIPVAMAELKKNITSLKIFSPYLTGDIAREFAELAKSASIYTLLNVQVLASGASDYQTILGLLQAGVTVYRVPNLHAKMILADGKFITIGSQNLTVGGANRNKEINVRLRGVSANVLRLVAKAEAGCEIITLELLEYVKKRADDFSERFATLKKDVDYVDREIDRHSRKLRSPRVGRTTTGENLMRNLSMRPHSNPRQCNVVSRYDDRNQKWKHSLKGENLLSWPMPGGIYRLKPKFRYLCVSTSGKIGWVRVNKTVYSFIEDEIEYPPGRIQSHLDWQISIDATNSEPRRGFSSSNLLVKVAVDGRSLCRIFMKYDIDNLIAYPPVGPYFKAKNKAPAKLTRNAIRWINSNLAEFEREVKQVFTTPFKFEENLTGVRADKFFGRNGTSLQLQLVDIGEGHALHVLK
ncbi:phospholipase D-like domain-containing protein [Pseudomonas viridiflava]|uniref:phospholipase D-like domain-containing protein n=1 Tax=Pseudomonas viridiflava TaxID=33069 RepID=UPI002EC6DC46|nr:phospholipase D-like domain-containing protein [Pseudomonas viridiflava]